MRQHKLFLILLLGYIGLSTVLIFRIPGFSAPNEDLHYEYIAMLRRNGRLPDPATSQRADERHQPPVYYTTATIFTIPFQNTKLDTEYQKNPFYTSTLQGNLNRFIHVSPSSAPELYVSRFVSLLFGIIGLFAVYWGARLTLPLSVTLLIVSLVAFQPTYLQLSAAVNNDLPASAISAALIAYSTYLIQKKRGPKSYLLWGVIFAVAMLTKASVIFLIVALFVSCWTVWREGQGGKTAVFCGVAGISTFLPIWITWLIFNQIRTQDALGLSASMPVSALFTITLNDFIGLLPYMGEIFRSYWLDWSPGVLGYGPWWFYALWCGVLLIALLGWFRKTTRSLQPTGVLRLHLFWVCALAGGFFAVKTLMVRDFSFIVPEGRWLLPILPSLAWLAGAGLSRWIGDKRQLRYLTYAALLPPISAVALIILFLPTRFPRAEKLNDMADIPHTVRPIHLTYNQEVKLLGFEADVLEIGQAEVVPIYWQAVQSPTADYTVSAQMLTYKDEIWQPISVQNSYPGSGLNPTSGWQIGDVYRDQLLFQPEGDLLGPTTARLVFSLNADGDSVSIEHNGQPVEWPVAGEVIVRPAKPIPLPEDGRLLNSPITFGNQFELAAFAYRFEANQLKVTLWWKAVTNLSEDYTIFVHALDNQGQIIAQSDATPANGASPTTIWQEGDVIVDQHRLDIGNDKSMILLVGAYDKQTITRLPASQYGSPLPDFVWRYEVP